MSHAVPAKPLSSAFHLPFRTLFSLKKFGPVLMKNMIEKRDQNIVVVNLGTVKMVVATNAATIRHILAHEDDFPKESGMTSVQNLSKNCPYLLNTKESGILLEQTVLYGPTNVMTNIK
eukprot:Lithocolla_globosa_v1_NODE_106_length_6331_cov_39.598311.p7 type:complete len:118 gc:universal NODE_106_length_6331_cov_39.598311:1009-656(-)